MSKSPFGWSYPAGAENDPNAPYNQGPDKCPVCEEYFDDLGRTCTATTHLECDCPKCQGLCICDRNDIDDHPPYDQEDE